jgi:hypothetical protein
VASRFDTVARTLKAELAKPYVYGEADCFFLGCRMADALMPGLDLVAKYSGSYTTLLGAQRALRRRKCTSLVELFARHLEPCAPAEARLGDLVIIHVKGAEHVGICLGTRFATKTERGRTDFELADCIAAFRLG